MSDDTTTVTTTTTTTTVTSRLSGQGSVTGAYGPIAHERLVLAVLLCTPNKFNDHWEKNDTSGMIDDLARLSLSGDAQELLSSMMKIIEQQKCQKAFLDVAHLMAELLYDGGAPHPPDGVMANAAKALQALD